MGFNKLFFATILNLGTVRQHNWENNLKNAVANFNSDYLKLDLKKTLCVVKCIDKFGQLLQTYRWVIFLQNLTEGGCYRWEGRCDGRLISCLEVWLRLMIVGCGVKIFIILYHFHKLIVITNFNLCFWVSFGTFLFLIIHKLPKYEFLVLIKCYKRVLV